MSFRRIHLRPVNSWWDNLLQFHFLLLLYIFLYHVKCVYHVVSVCKPLFFYRFWPQEVRDRVRSTYMYFTGSLGVTGLSAYYISRSKLVFRMMSANPWVVSPRLLFTCSWVFSLFGLSTYWCVVSLFALGQSHK